MRGFFGEFGLEAFALDALAFQLAGAADRFGGLTGAALGGLFIVPAEFHLAEHAFALHFLFKRLERLIDIVIANENLHWAAFSCCCGRSRTIRGLEPHAHV